MPVVTCACSKTVLLLRLIWEPLTSAPTICRCDSFVLTPPLELAFINTTVVVGGKSVRSPVQISGEHVSIFRFRHVYGNIGNCRRASVRVACQVGGRRHKAFADGQLCPNDLVSGRLLENQPNHPVIQPYPYPLPPRSSAKTSV